MAADSYRAFDLRNASEDALARLVFTNPDYDNLKFIIPMMREAQNEFRSSVNLPSIILPVGVVTFMENTMKLTVTSTAGAAGMRIVTNISWADETKMPYTGIPEFAFVAGSNVVSTGTALQTITGLTLPLLANSTYDFHARLFASTSAVTTGTGYGVNFSAAGAVITAGIDGPATSTTQKTSPLITAFNTAVTGFLTTSNQNGKIVIEGRITTGANAGNIIMQHIKPTSGVSTVLIGSRLIIIKVL